MVNQLVLTERGLNQFRQSLLMQMTRCLPSHHQFFLTHLVPAHTYVHVRSRTFTFHEGLFKDRSFYVSGNTVIIRGINKVDRQKIGISYLRCMIVTVPPRYFLRALIVAGAPVVKMER